MIHTSLLSYKDAGTLNLHPSLISSQTSFISRLNANNKNKKHQQILNVLTH